MGIATILTAVGLVAGIGGTVMSYQASQRQEGLIRRQNEIENDRRKRQSLREAIRAAAVSETAAANQGGLGSSSLAGGVAQAMASTGMTQTYSNQNLNLANQMSSARSSANSANAMTSFGSGISSLGGTFLQQQQRLNRLGLSYNGA